MSLVSISITMISRLMLNIQNPRLLEESTIDGYLASVEASTLITTNLVANSGTTESCWAEDQSIDRF